MLCVIGQEPQWSGGLSQQIRTDSRWGGMLLSWLADIKFNVQRWSEQHVKRQCEDVITSLSLHGLFL